MSVNYPCYIFPHQDEFVGTSIPSEADCFAVPELPTTQVSQNISR